MVSSSSAFDDDDDDDDDVSFLLSKSFSSSSPSFFFESATRRILFRRPRCVRPRSKRVLVARVERRTKLFEKVEDDDDDEENHGAERTAPPPTRTVKEDVMFSLENTTLLFVVSVYVVKVFPTIDAEVSRAVFSQSARFEIQFKCGEKRTAFSPKIRCCERERRATPTTTPSEEENQDQHSEEVKANTTRSGRRNTS
jgi:hypothetical protein